MKTMRPPLRHRWARFAARKSRSLFIPCVALLAVIGGGLLFGQGTKERSAAEKFLGTWTVRYTPESREALDYALKKQPLPRSAKPANTPSPDRLEITLKDGQLNFDGFTAQVFSGTNDPIAYHYAIGSKTSQWGVATCVLYASPDGKVYGVRSRLFWGRTNDLPPMVSAARFVLERNK